MRMTPKERLLCRLEGKPVDKIPNMNITMQFAAQHIGVKYGDFCRDYRVLVAAQKKAAEDFGIDMMSTLSDPYRETFDFGAKVRYQEDYLPAVTEPLIADIEDFDKIRLWDPMQSERMLDRIRAVELFKAQCGDAYPILGWVEGPWAEFTDLADISEAMMMLFDEPEEVCRAMDMLTEQAIRCALAQVEAGADFIGIGDAAASLISADNYRDYVFAREKKIIDAVHAAGARVKLHICGNINHLIADMVQSGADIVDIDYMVDMKKAIDAAQDRCAICGQINPTDVILQGSVEDNRRWTRICVENGNARSIVASGCEIPRMTPPENVMAIHEELLRIAQEEA